MGLEIELKLHIAESDTEKFQQIIEPQATFTGKHNLRNQYFDTPQLALHQAACALRIRSNRQRFEQTLKTAGQANAALQKRAEWNWPLANHALDLSLLQSEEVQQVWPAQVQLADLQPIFTTHFQRQTWLWEQQGSQIEIALDQGEVATAQQQQSFCEVELELWQGDEQQLWLVYEWLAQQLPLSPSTISKAQRGYQLLLSST